MFETFFGFKKEPFSQNPDSQQLYESRNWSQVRARLQFIVDHRGVGLITGEVGAGKSTAIRIILGALNPMCIRSFIPNGVQARPWTCCAWWRAASILNRRTVAPTWCTKSRRQSFASIRRKSNIHTRAG
jgi:ABC-type transport system involved in cytochrome bd biosynthesis fused ATPase/permease subunit